MALSRALSSLLCLKRHGLPGEGMPEHVLSSKELVGHDLSDLDSDCVQCSLLAFLAQY